MALPDARVVGGRASGGEVVGRAVLLVAISHSMWEVHDVPWDAPDSDCTDSYWDDGEILRRALEEWAVEWVPSADLESFIAEHFLELSPADVFRRFGAAGNHG